MRHLRNDLLRLVVRSAAQSARERGNYRSRCTAASWHVHLQQLISDSTHAAGVATRRFASSADRLQRASWTGCPRTEQQSRELEHNGFKWTDEYSWMDAPARDQEHQHLDSRLSDHLTAEDAHARRALEAGGVGRLAAQLLREMREVYVGQGAGEDPPPERLGPYTYAAVSGPDGGLQAYVRTRVAPLAGTAGGGGSGGGGGGRPQVLLDAQVVAADARLAAQMTGLHLGLEVGAIKLCPRHRLLAYTLPVVGGAGGGPTHDLYCALVRDTATGKLLLPGGVVGGVAGPGGLELAADGRSLLVTVPDAEGRPCRVMLHDLRCARPPALLLSEPDPRFFLALGRTKDWALLLLSSNSKTSSEVYVLDASRPWASPPSVVQPRRPGLEYFVEHHRHSPAAAGGAAAAGGGGGGATPPELDSCTASSQRPSALTASAQQQQQQRQRQQRPQAGGLKPQPGSGPERSAGIGQGGGGDGVVADGGTTGHLIILTNVDPAALGGSSGAGSSDPDGTFGRELTVVCAPLATPGLAHWRPLLPAEAGAEGGGGGGGTSGGRGLVVTDMDKFDDCVVLYERRMDDGRPAVSVMRLEALPPQPQPQQQQRTGAESCASAGAFGRGGGAGVVGSRPVRVPLPAWALHVSPGINADPSSPTLRLTASSPLHPPAAFDYHFATRALQPLWQAAPPTAAAAALLRRCTLLRLSVPSPPLGPSPADGGTAAPGGGRGTVQVPVTLVLPPGAALAATAVAAATSSAAGSSVVTGVPGPVCQLVAAPTEAPSTGDGSVGGRGVDGLGDGDAQIGPRPLLLSVYGAYGIPLDLQYDAAALCLLARGWALAKVHVRGGGELGRSWHAAGARSLKAAGAADCVAAAEALVAAGVTAPGLVAGHAVSAGGLVLAAALSSRPDLWGAAVLRCPFVELLSSSGAGSGSGGRPSCSSAESQDAQQEEPQPNPPLPPPLAAHEWDEWGSPADPQQWAALGELCPYRQLQHPRVGPGWRAAVLASCAHEDPRVPAGTPAKWVARLRERLRATGHVPPESAQQNLSTVGKEDTTGGGGSGGSGSSGGSTDGGVSQWRRLLGRVLGGGSTGTTAVRQEEWEERQAHGHHDGKSGGGGDLGVCAPLLRVHYDRTGHVRVGEAAAAEAAEEMAFLLTATALPVKRPPLPP